MVLNAVVFCLQKCLELGGVGGNDMRVTCEDRQTCETAQSKQCEWCELPEEYIHQDFVSKLGGNCNGSQIQPLKELEDCADISSKAKCLCLDHCSWCSSDVLNDGCFRAWEARKLPTQVFECTKGS
ncbi:hypothetical protein KP509_39G022000 [Ceratopteris richardii]|uniref:Uncharacterized protein n=1 Tax=Ceratopteris richardii TaxID=49495 RepID=A0A8T2PZD7_CERRI|nr:hypothetical protein KP509_39G022000 [Ceratopteris richardii]